MFGWPNTLGIDMKKAVIQTGGKQYVVSEGETITVELIKDSAKTLSFEPLLLINGETTEVGKPTLAKNKVSAEVVEADVQSDKVTSIRYKAKKRVHKVRGHRQHQTILKITKIT
jgi:large subunit ribosomal protein L21